MTKHPIAEWAEYYGITDWPMTLIALLALITALLQIRSARKAIKATYESAIMNRGRMGVGIKKIEVIDNGHKTFRTTFLFKNIGGSDVYGIDWGIRYGIVKPVWHRHPLILNSRWWHGMAPWGRTPKVSVDDCFEWTFDLHDGIMVQQSHVITDGYRIGKEPMTVHGNLVYRDNYGHTWYRQFCFHIMLQNQNTAFFLPCPKHDGQECLSKEFPSTGLKFLSLIRRLLPRIKLNGI